MPQHRASFLIICSPFGHAHSGIFSSFMFLLSEADHWESISSSIALLFYNERFVLVLAVSWSCSFSFVLSILSINIHPPDTSIQGLYLSWGYYRNTVYLRLTEYKRSFRTWLLLRIHLKSHRNFRTFIPNIYSIYRIYH